MRVMSFLCLLLVFSLLSPAQTLPHAVRSTVDTFNTYSIELTLLTSSMAVTGLTFNYMEFKTFLYKDVSSDIHTLIGPLPPPVLNEVDPHLVVAPNITVTSPCDEPNKCALATVRSTALTIVENTAENATNYSTALTVLKVVPRDSHYPWIDATVALLKNLLHILTISNVILFVFSLLESSEQCEAPLQETPNASPVVDSIEMIMLVTLSHHDSATSPRLVSKRSFPEPPSVRKPSTVTGTTTPAHFEMAMFSESAFPAATPEPAAKKALPEPPSAEKPDTDSKIEASSIGKAEDEAEDVVETEDVETEADTAAETVSTLSAGLQFSLSSSLLMAAIVTIAQSPLIRGYLARKDFEHQLNGETTGELITEEFTTEETTEEPATATEEPSTEEPSTEEPSSEEPATEEPATEEPATEEPATEEPSTVVAYDRLSEVPVLIMAYEEPSEEPSVVAYDRLSEVPVLIMAYEEPSEEPSTVVAYDRLSEVPVLIMAYEEPTEEPSTVVEAYDPLSEVPVILMAYEEPTTTTEPATKEPSTEELAVVEAYDRLSEVPVIMKASEDTVEAPTTQEGETQASWLTSSVFMRPPELPILEKSLESPMTPAKASASWIASTQDSTKADLMSRISSACKEAAEMKVSLIKTKKVDDDKKELDTLAEPAADKREIEISSIVNEFEVVKVSSTSSSSSLPSSSSDAWNADELIAATLEFEWLHNEQVSKQSTPPSMSTTKSVDRSSVSSSTSNFDILSSSCLDPAKFRPTKRLQLGNIITPKWARVGAPSRRTPHPSVLAASKLSGSISKTSASVSKPSGSISKTSSSVSKPSVVVNPTPVVDPSTPDSVSKPSVVVNPTPFVVPSTSPASVPPSRVWRPTNRPMLGNIPASASSVVVNPTPVVPSISPSVPPSRVWRPTNRPMLGNIPAPVTFPNPRVKRAAGVKKA